MIRTDTTNDTIQLHPGMVSQVARLEDAQRLAELLQAQGWPVVATDDPGASWRFSSMGNLIAFEKDVETALNELWPPFQFTVAYEAWDTDPDVKPGDLFVDVAHRPPGDMEFRPDKLPRPDAPTP